MSKNKKKYRLKKKPMIIAILLLTLGVGSLGYYTYTALNKNKSPILSYNVSDSGREVGQNKDMADNNNIGSKLSKIQIQLNDSAIIIGTKFKAYCLLVPDDSEATITWSASDPSVIKVTNDGLVEVVGIGKSALVATVGNLTDAVIIEGVEKKTDGSSLGLPVYSEEDFASGLVANAANASASHGGQKGSYLDDDLDQTIRTESTYGQSGSNSSGSSSNSSANSSSNSSGNGSAGLNSSSNQSSGQNQAYSQGGNSDGGSGSWEGAGSSSSSSSSGSSSSSYEAPSSSDSANEGEAGSSSGLESDQVAGELDGLGFEHMYSNVYSYSTDGVYSGEIITQPNAAIIYIKHITPDFESRIKEVIERLLPGQSGLVWSNYINSGTDRTFTVDGKKVRIVVSSRGGHSQIVIYN